MKLSIIFVNWNSTAYLRECLASLYKHAATPFEAIVVDNASPVRDAATLKDVFPEVKLIESATNLGFAGANNLGFRNSCGENLLFLNPDTKLIGPALESMLQQLESSSHVGIVGCRLLNEDLSVQTSCIQAFPTILNQALDMEILQKKWPKSRLWGIAPLSSDYRNPASVEVISGACMMVRREVFKQIGMFTEDYFMYAEDLDLCRKAINAGYSNYYVGNVSILHYGGKSSNPQSATVMKWRAIVRYCYKHHGWTYTLAFRGVLSAAALLRLTLIAVGSSSKMFARPGEFSVWKKWRSILKTLLSTSGASSPGVAIALPVVGRD